MATRQFEELMEKFLAETLSPDEIKLFITEAADPANETIFKDLLLKNMQSGEYQGLSDNSKNLDDLFQQMLQRADGMTNEKAKLVPIYRRPFFKWVAAACIVGLLVAGYWLMRKQNGKSETTKENIATTHDVKAPGTNRAMITLSDGRKIYLDSIGNGQLAMQGRVKLTKLSDGEIVYETTDDGRQTTVTYNTLTNPRGSKVIDMILSDGSHVWLDAGSSVTYPIAFVENERKVAITGQAYFEVAHDKSKPFIVSKGDMQIEVLGTHFNVNAFDDEENIKVTLLEGSVRVRSRESGVTIKPGEQALLTPDSRLLTNSSPDLEQVMAWKNGLFNFNHADLKTVMQELARWYDMEVHYEGTIAARRFRGEITRDLNLSQVLKLLEDVQIKFRIEGKTLVVMQ